jgi:hypothetical protein
MAIWLDLFAILGSFVLLLGWTEFFVVAAVLLAYIDHDRASKVSNI